MNKIYKKKSGDGRTTQNGLSIAFLLYMGILYPLIMHDKYFDITLTKYKAFEVALCIYAVLMALAVLLDIFDGRRPFDMFKSKNGYIAADLFMAGFLVSNLAAFALSEDKLDAYTGEAGRRCGLQFVILIVILYICMGRGLKLEKFVLPTFLAAGSFTGIIAVFQYIGVDFLDIREGLSSSIKDIYISTFGNIDIFASFICVVIPVALGLGLDERPIYDGDVVWKLNWTKLLSWFALFIGAAAVVVTNANLAYAGVGAAVWRKAEGISGDDVCYVSRIPDSESDDKDIAGECGKTGWNKRIRETYGKRRCGLRSTWTCELDHSDRHTCRKL